MRKKSNSWIIIPIILFGISLSMFATLYHCPEWLQELPTIIAGCFVIGAFLMFLIALLLIIEAFSDE